MKNDIDDMGKKYPPARTSVYESLENLIFRSNSDRLSCNTDEVNLNPKFLYEKALFRDNQTVPLYMLYRLDYGII